MVDTNLLAYLLLGGSGLAAARNVYLRDPVWHGPLLWRSEFRSVLAAYLRRRSLTVNDAIEVQQKAEELLAGREHVVPSERVLRLVASSDCSAYDCESVALAEQLRVFLVTSDRAALKSFPAIAVSPARFLARWVPLRGGRTVGASYTNVAPVGVFVAGDAGRGAGQ